MNCLGQCTINWDWFPFSLVSPQHQVCIRAGGQVGCAASASCTPQLPQKLPPSRENISLTTEISTSSNDLDPLTLLKWRIWKTFLFPCFSHCMVSELFPRVLWVTAPILSHWVVLVVLGKCGSAGDVKDTTFCITHTHLGGGKTFLLVGHFSEKKMFYDVQVWEKCCMMFSWEHRP